MVTADQLKAQFGADPRRTASLLARVLNDFGYPVDPGYVEAEMRRLLDGGDLKGGPSMFLAGWLEDGID